MKEAGRSFNFGGPLQHEHITRLIGEVAGGGSIVLVNLNIRLPQWDLGSVDARKEYMVDWLAEVHVVENMYSNLCLKVSP